MNSDKETIKPDPAAAIYLRHGQAPRVNTDCVIRSALESTYRTENITIVPEQNCDILAFAAAGHAIAAPLPVYDGAESAPNQWHLYQPPSSRVDGNLGRISHRVLFGKFSLNWKSKQFILYVVDGRDGSEAYPNIRLNYIISSDKAAVQSLILEAGSYGVRLHGEIWVYDQGWWQKSADLWSSIQRSKWEDVILDSAMKEALISDVNRFYDTKSTYKRLGVPWKRGLIFHGPPGNGKTISIKATMHMLYDRKDPVPTLYVKSLANYGGPERSLNDIFSKARSEAPCYLVFEDLDSLVTDQVRSFFLNQVDGLAANDGILMIGSTNHLERLDPGISKRPSRFDRLYFFPNPDFDQRVQYAEFWRGKVLNNNKASQDDENLPDIEFPEDMCKAVAKVTDDFSFAYMQEAFLASLLQLALDSDESPSSPAAGYVKLKREGDNENDGNDDDDLEKYVLWREFKKQVKILREQLGTETERRSTLPPPLLQNQGSGQDVGRARPIPLSRPAIPIQRYQKAVPM